jgi:F0F1-type ATP synthase assembly protein I
MANNSENYYGTEQGAYTRRKEQMAKRNSHAQKNGSNYHPSVKKEGAAEKKLPQRQKLPVWVNVMLGVMFGVLGLVLILRLTAFKDSMPMSYVSSLLLGLCCGALFYVRQTFQKKSKKGGGNTAVTWVLAVIAVIYTVMGLIGLIGLLF